MVMTKFVLVGGYPTKSEDEGQSFLNELVEGFDQPVHILICLFARPEDTWQEIFEKDKFLFASSLRQKVILELANTEHFKEQMQKSDVIYFRGGKTKKLLEAVKKYEGWEKELSGKTVAGTSAGVNFLAKYYYSLDNLEVCPGLNILPVTALVHYLSDYNAPNVDWDNAYQELKAVAPDSPVLTLKEGEFKVIVR